MAQPETHVVGVFEVDKLAHVGKPAAQLVRQPAQLHKCGACGVGPGPLVSLHNYISGV